MNQRIHIFGASGTGTTTLGRFLSNRLGIPHFDSDDYYWIKSTIPFTQKREVRERSELLKSDLQPFSSWVLSGSLCGWGDFAIPLFTLVIFLWIPTELRMSRLKERAIKRYGAEALLPGGWFHENHEDFMAWASAYDVGGSDMRSRVLHEQWMDELPCKLIRLEETGPVEDLATTIENKMSNSRRAGN